MIPITPDVEPASRPLDADVERGLRWTAIRQIITALVGVTGVLVYARFISPGDLGAASLAVLVYDGLVLLIREPIGTAIVYFQGDETDHPSAAFWLLMAFSLPVGLAVVIAAPWIAAFYHEPTVAGLTQVIVAAFLVTAVGTAPASLLTKRMQFRLREIFLTVYALVELAGWIGLAVMGFGPWSLVLPVLVGSVFWAAANWIAARFRPALRPHRAAFGDIFRYSRKVWGSQLLAYLMDKMDNAAVGTLGQAPLGLYAFGESQATFATFSVATVIAGVLLPAMAKIQDRLDECRRVYLDMLRLTAATTMPMQIGAMVVADLGLTLVYGDQWAGAVSIFRAYLFYQTFTAFSTLSGSVVAALGRPDIPLRLNLAQLPLFVAATWFGLVVWGGIFGVAMSLAIVRTLVAVVYVVITWRVLRLPLRAALAVLFPSAASALLMGLAASAVRAANPAGGWPALGLTVAVAAPLYFALLWLFDRAGFAHLLRSGWQIFVPERLSNIAYRISYRLRERFRTGKRAKLDLHD